MVSGTLNGVPLKTLLESDGKYGPGLKPNHWLRSGKKLLEDTSFKAGATIDVSLEPTKEWIKAEVPEDPRKALDSPLKAKRLWEDSSPLVRWDWIRWIRAVKTPETRKKTLKALLTNSTRE